MTTTNTLKKSPFTKKSYERARAKMHIALTSDLYKYDDEKRAVIVKYYRQCMYNIVHNKPLPLRPC